MHMQSDKVRGPADAEERLLLERIAAGDRAALASLYELYHGRLFKFVFRLTSSYTLADELVNDVMLLVWRRASSFRGESRISTWIFGIAYRQTMRRVSRRKPAMAPLSSLDGSEPGREPALETENWVQRGIRSLPGAQQMTVILVFYLGLTYEETAEITGCPVNTVKTRMFHARRRLKQLLEQHAMPSGRQSERDDD